MFRVLHPDMQQVLRGLSSAGMIYVGREGIGLSRLFAKEVLRLGTIKAVEQHGSRLGEEEIRLLELTAIEGPRWICYQRVIDALWNVQKYAPGEKAIREEQEAMSTEIWPLAGRSQV